MNLRRIRHVHWLSLLDLRILYVYWLFIPRHPLPYLSYTSSFFSTLTSTELDASMFLTSYLRFHLVGSCGDGGGDGGRSVCDGGSNGKDICGGNGYSSVNDGGIGDVDRGGVGGSVFGGRGAGGGILVGGAAIAAAVVVVVVAVMVSAIATAVVLAVMVEMVSVVRRLRRRRFWRISPEHKNAANPKFPSPFLPLHQH